jgi:hypothetical protein
METDVGSAAYCPPGTSRRSRRRGSSPSRRLAAHDRRRGEERIFVRPQGRFARLLPRTLGAGPRPGASGGPGHHTQPHGRASRRPRWSAATAVLAWHRAAAPRAPRIRCPEPLRRVASARGTIQEYAVLNAVAVAPVVLGGCLAPDRRALVNHEHAPAVRFPVLRSPERLPLVRGFEPCHVRGPHLLRGRGRGPPSSRDALATSGPANRKRYPGRVTCESARSRSEQIRIDTRDGSGVGRAPRFAA